MSLVKTINALISVSVIFLSTRAFGDTPTLQVAVSNYPLAYFAERLGGPSVSVVFPVPPGEDPAFFKPDKKAISQLQRAELIALNGADYEKWLTRVSLPASRVVVTANGFRDRFIRIEHAVTHSHGPGGLHSHDGTAFTTWLDFDQARLQARALAEAMIVKRPRLRESIHAALNGLEADLRALDQTLMRLAAPHQGQPILASHPVYQYLARRYDLSFEAVHWEPDQAPDAAEWPAFESLKARHPARVMLWEGSPDPSTAARLETLGVHPVVFDPCANRPESGDFLSVMQANLKRLEMAFR